MAHSSDINPVEDHQTPQIHQITSDEIQERRTVDHLIEMEQIDGEDRSCLQTNIKIFDEMFKDLDNLSIKSCTIFKVNVGLRELNPDAYTPKMVSIGPYHEKNPRLRPMEKYKLLYLRRFLQRKGLDVGSCMSELEKLKAEALKCYDNTVDNYNDTTRADQFLRMLLLDGCFVVEFIRERNAVKGPKEAKIIINVSFIIALIRQDLMLLENQLPFFVLTMLHDLKKQDDELPLPKLVWYAFVDIFPKKNTFILNGIKKAVDFKHLLHLMHTSYQPSEPKSSRRLTDASWLDVMPNASELSDAGVNFVKAEHKCSAKDKGNTGDSTSLFDIKFENGVMKIPSFKVTDYTETLLQNLIAYEQHVSNVHSRYFTDFTIFMDYLIDADEEVSLLSQKGIIINRIGKDTEVANLISKIGKGVVNLEEVFFYYEEQTKKANQYCQKPWNRMKASLMRNYFDSPWTGASTLAAIILLILTAMQTVLAFTGGVKK